MSNIFGFHANCGPRLIVATHILWLATSFCVASDVATGTVLVGLWDKRTRTLVLGADSLVRYQQSGRTFTRCKILQCGAFGFVGMAGVYTKPNPAFDLAALLTKSCRSSSDIRTAADRFLAVSKAPFDAVIQYMKVNEAAAYRDMGERSVEGIFAGLERGRQALLARGWRVDDQGGLEGVSDEVDPSLINLQNAFLSGTNDHILKYVATHKEWEAMGYVQAARLFIRIESEAHPSTVGGPPSILTIDEHGRARWIEQGACPAIK